ncbi:LAFA_0D06348g1_1 [Lachancea sp. 'fantastica']|nr:LAFA_0D06348g1_1 [Lachancea sp. 'fantastica']
MSYSQHSAFLDGEIEKFQNFGIPELQELDPNVISSLRSTLARELVQRQQKAFRMVNRDEILLAVQKQEKELLRQDLYRVMASVGDLPKDRIGADLIDLQEARDGKFVSLEQLMKDIENLPHVSALDSEDLDAQPLLHEYNQLREGLKGKSIAIREGSRLIPELKGQLDRFESLEHAIQRHGTQPAEYYAEFKHNVLVQAQETARLVETVLQETGKLSKEYLEQLESLISALRTFR